jgi:hypothetical protein
VLSFCGCTPEEPDPVTPPVSDQVQPDPAPDPVQPDPVPGPAVQPDPPSGEVPGDGNAQYEQPNEALRIEEKYEAKTFSAGGRVVVHLDLNYPYADGKGVTADCIREYYDLWAQRQLESAEFDLLPQAESQFAGLQDGAFMPYSVSWSFDTTRMDETVIAVLQTGYQQTGGAHPNNLLAAQNFNAQNGGLLALSDIFAAEESVYLEAIRTLVLPMMQQREQKDGIFYYGGYEGYMMQVFDPADFCLTETGLRLFWQTDSVAPHAAGIQIFDLTYEQLGDLMNPQWK